MHDVTVTQDRRRLRTRRSHEAVIDAMLDLYRDGQLRPGVIEIATRAGVSERTVFRLFDDLEALALATIERQAARVGHLFAPPDRHGNREQRIAALVTHRLRLYAEIAPTARAAQVRLPFSPVMQAGFAHRQDLLRRQLERQFQVELATQEEPDRAQLLAALEIATGIETLELLCHGQGRPAESAGAVVTRIVRALLNDSEPGRAS